MDFLCLLEKWKVSKKTNLYLVEKQPLLILCKMCNRIFLKMCCFLPIFVVHSIPI